MIETKGIPKNEQGLAERRDELKMFEEIREMERQQEEQRVGR